MGRVAPEQVEFNPHLSQMSTEWTMVFQAHSAKPGEVSPVLSRLMCRYSGAVHRYLLKAIRNPDIAAELNQEFAVRFLRGDFRHSDPSRGRFRDYVKRAVQNLINDHHRRRRPQISLDPDLVEPSAEDSRLVEFDREFVESWRQDLIDRGWAALLELERSTGQAYHTVLRTRVDHPELNSTALAERLSAELGRPFTPGGVRMTLQRARGSFAVFLIREVAKSLKPPTYTRVEEELSDLGLLQFCRPHLKRKGFSS